MVLRILLDGAGYACRINRNIEDLFIVGVADLMEAKHYVQPGLQARSVHGLVYRLLRHFQCEERFFGNFLGH